MVEFKFFPKTFMQTLPRLIQTVSALHQDKEYELTIKEKRKKRSLDANAYMWVLLDKLAVELSKDGPTISPEEIYKNLIPHVGGNSEIVPVREDAVQAWIQNWQEGRLGWSCVDVGPCKNLPGYHYIKCYYGSSVYDTKQMKRLIELVVQECKDQGIETATPEELARLTEEWGI